MDNWINYWSKTPYKPILEIPPANLYGGTNIEPLASIGMSCFLDAVQDKFIDGFSIIDYGCGAGILANFISSRLQNFKYYGLEPSGTHGSERLDLAKHYLVDNRCQFGFIELDYDSAIQNRVDAIILISVFTHLIQQDVATTLDNLIKVYKTNPNCSIVFSCFIDEVERVENHQPLIWERFYGTSHITHNFLQEYCDHSGLKLEHHTTFVAQGNHKHEIFKITKL
jgi:SAM-dependent methyltransferase